MNRHTTGGMLSICCVFTLYAQTYQLQGTIKNQADFPVKNMVVKLARAGHQTVTDTGGNFLIGGTAYLPRGTGSTQRISAFPVLRNQAIVVSVQENATEVVVEMVAGNGRRIGTIERRTVGPGEHRFPLKMENGGMSVALAIIRVGASVFRAKLLWNGAAYCMSGNNSWQAAKDFSKKAGQPLDTLQFFRKDSLEYAIPVTAASARYQILLDLLPYEITEDVAIKEDRRGPEEVGSELRALNIYPYDVWTYLTGPDDAWCSEFLCWAYRVAGYPTGTDAGTATRPRWLLKGNTTIRDWFQTTANKHEWIDRTSSQWETFTPVYGDFVRYDNSSGGHTGIVRWVSGTTLYTVEGNVSNQVRLRTITNYKNNTTIDGFGRRSGVRKDSHTQVF